MKKFLTSALLLVGLSAMAQISATTSDSASKWTYGGYAGVGGAFGGSGGTSIYISPRGGYKITEDFEAGIAGNFTWTSNRHHSTIVLGGGPFVNYYFSRNFYATGLFQQYFVNQKIKNSDISGSVNESALYIGGGYMQHLGGKTYMQIGGMYNVLYNSDRSIFSSGFVPSVGVVVGL